jgi:hypothetical protein
MQCNEQRTSERSQYLYQYTVLKNVTKAKTLDINIIHSLHFLFCVYCPTNVHFYSLLICETHSYMFRALSRFVFRDFSVLNCTYFYINGTIIHWLKW